MMSPQVATDIGGRIGTVEEVEKRRTNDSLSLFMRLRVSVSVSKPLRRGCFVSDSDGNHTWLRFKYERLAMFCYFCGFVGHDVKHCAGFFAAEKNGASMELQYSDWLKAVGGRQKTTSRAEGEMRMENEMAMQNRAIQKVAGGMSKLAAQRVADGTLPVFLENIPRKDTGPRMRKVI